MTHTATIAQIWCTLARSDLWAPRAGWVGRVNPEARLGFHINPDRSAYHKYRGDIHTITIGVGYIDDILASPVSASRWRVFEEIHDRGYFESNAEPAELLVHTLCHEFTHFLQTIRGLHNIRNTHDIRFYETLDQIHEKGHALHLLNRFKARCQARSLALTFEETMHPANAGG